MLKRERLSKADVDTCGVCEKVVLGAARAAESNDHVGKGDCGKKISRKEIIIKANMQQRIDHEKRENVTETIIQKMEKRLRAVPVVVEKMV